MDPIAVLEAVPAIVLTNVVAPDVLEAWLLLAVVWDEVPAWVVSDWLSRIADDDVTFDDAELDAPPELDTEGRVDCFVDAPIVAVLVCATNTSHAFSNVQ